MFPFNNCYFTQFIWVLCWNKFCCIFSCFLGMILASFSVSAAGVVEFFRQEYPRFGFIINHVNGNITINGTNLTIWYQFPQYGLMGFSEIFVLIAGKYSVFHYSLGAESCVVPNKYITSQLLAFLKSYSSQL